MSLESLVRGPRASDVLFGQKAFGIDEEDVEDLVVLLNCHRLGVDPKTFCVRAETCSCPLQLLRLDELAQGPRFAHIESFGHAEQLVE